MYEAYFGLATLPFCIAPDSRFYVDAAPHRAAIRALHHGFRHGAEFLSLVGEAGAGKTTVGRRMLEQVDRARQVAAELPCRRLSGDQLFDRVAEALGMRRSGGVPPLGNLISQLEGLVRDGRNALLLVDEAQQLDVSALRRLRKLTSVRVEGRAALRVCLVGRSTPPCIEALQRMGWPLNVGAPVQVEPLDAAGTHEYVLERLRRAGWTGRPAFERTTAAIHECCKGNPGRVNRLCGHILLQLHIHGRDDVNAEVVRAVDELLQAELSGKPAMLALPPRAHDAAGPDTRREPPSAAPAPAGVDRKALIASLIGRTPPRLPDTGFAAPPPTAAAVVNAAKPRRRGLAQAVAALALLVTGAFLGQAISQLPSVRSEPARPAAASVMAATVPAGHDAPPARAAAENGTSSPPSIPTGAGLAAMAERAIAQSPPAATRAPVRAGSAATPASTPLAGASSAH